MKKILILAPLKSENKVKLLTFLKKYFAGKVEITLGLYADLTFEIESEKVVISLAGKNVDEFDLVYFRNTKGYLPMVVALSTYLEAKKKIFFDKYFIGDSFTGDKFTSLVRLAVGGTPIIPSYLCATEAIQKNSQNIINILGFPVVAKEVTTQRMRSIYSIKSIEDFEKLPKLTERGLPARYLFQKFIDFDREFRLVVLGDEVGVAHTKTKRDNANFELQYADMNENPEFLDLSEVPDTIKSAAVDAAKALHIQIAGVDVCRERETGKVYVIEVNRGPGIDYDTAVSNELEKIAEFFEKELSKND